MSKQQTATKWQSGWEMANRHWDEMWELGFVQLLVYLLGQAFVPLARALVVPLQKVFNHFVETGKMGSRAIIAFYLGWLAIVLISTVVFLLDANVGTVLLLLFLVMPWEVYVLKRIIWNGIGACMWRDLVAAWRWSNSSLHFKGKRVQRGVILATVLVIAAFINPYVVRSSVGRAFIGTMDYMATEVAPAMLAKAELAMLGKMVPVICPGIPMDLDFMSLGADYSGIDMLDYVTVASAWCVSGGADGPLGKFAWERLEKDCD